MPSYEVVVKVWGDDGAMLWAASRSGMVVPDPEDGQITAARTAGKVMLEQAEVAQEIADQAGLDLPGRATDQDRIDAAVCLCGHGAALHHLLGGCTENCSCDASRAEVVRRDERS